MEIIVASHNRKKAKELKALLPDRFLVKTLADIGYSEEIIENGQTFSENARIKALQVSKVFPEVLILADDSGLEVEAINWGPGVYSARFSGENASDAANVAKLLDALKSFQGKENRRAQFQCILVLAQNGSTVEEFRGICKGRIAEQVHGSDGFGYDPVFVPEGYDETFAQMRGEEKAKISHRGRAMEQLVHYLQGR